MRVKTFRFLIPDKNAAFCGFAVVSRCSTKFHLFLSANDPEEEDGGQTVLDERLQEAQHRVAAPAVHAR